MILDSRQKTQYFYTLTSMRDAVTRFNEIYKKNKPVEQEIILNQPNNESNKSLFARLTYTKRKT